MEAGLPLYVASLPGCTDNDVGRFMVDSNGVGALCSYVP
jgi:hypothetical protein